MYGCSRLREDPDPVGHLDDPAEVHHRDAVADVLDDAHVVGDEDVRQSQLPLEGLEQVQDLGLDGDVEGRDRLVADDEVRLQHQSPGDPDPLPLAAAELVRVAPGVVRLEPDHVHDPRDPGLRARERSRSRGCEAPRRCCRRSACGGRASRTGPGRRSASAAGSCLSAAPSSCVMSTPSSDDRPRRRLEEAQEEPSDGRLAAAGFPDEAERLALPDLEGHAVDGPHRGPRCAEEAALDREVLRRGPGRRRGARRRPTGPTRFAAAERPTRPVRPVRPARHGRGGAGRAHRPSS